MKYGFGVDLGGTTVKIAFFDETGTLLDKWEIPTVTANYGAQILSDIAASVQKYMDEKKIVTFEMFKKYHENLMNYIENGDGINLDDILEEEPVEDEE